MSQPNGAELVEKLTKIVKATVILSDADLVAFKSTVAYPYCFDKIAPNDVWCEPDIGLGLFFWCDEWCWFSERLQTYLLPAMIQEMLFPEEGWDDQEYLDLLAASAHETVIIGLLPEPAKSLVAEAIAMHRSRPS